MMMILSNSRDCPNCGSDHKSKPFCIYADGYHCFSCGQGRRGDRLFSVESTKVSPTLPEIKDYKSSLNSFTIQSQKWLSGFYVTENMVRKHSIFEVVESGKIWLVFPKVENGEIKFYQKRCINERSFLSYGDKKSLLSSEGHRSVVIVEDFISYIRLASFCDVVCLMGTYLSIEECNHIVDTYTKIFVWLDNDVTKTINSGQVAARKIMDNLRYSKHYKQSKKLFTILDSRILNICTKKDPKCYSDSELRSIINAPDK